MAYVVTDGKYYKGVADKIRSYLCETDQRGIKPAEMPEQIAQAVEKQRHDAALDGFSEGRAAGYTESELVMWNYVTQNGKRTIYNGAFMDWGIVEFDPPILVQPTASYISMLFAYNPCMEFMRGKKC